MEKVIKVINKKYFSPGDHSFRKEKSFEERIDVIDFKITISSVRKMFSKDFKEFILLLNANHLKSDIEG